MTILHDVAPPGYRAELSTVDAGISPCRGCAFERDGIDCGSDRPCCPSDRLDECQVIFVPMNDETQEMMLHAGVVKEPPAVAIVGSGATTSPHLLGLRRRPSFPMGMLLAASMGNMLAASPFESLTFTAKPARVPEPEGETKHDLERMAEAERRREIKARKKEENRRRAQAGKLRQGTTVVSVESLDRVPADYGKRSFDILVIDEPRGTAEVKGEV